MVKKSTIERQIREMAGLSMTDLIEVQQQMLRKPANRDYHRMRQILQDVSLSDQQVDAKMRFIKRGVEIMLNPIRTKQEDAIINQMGITPNPPAKQLKEFLRLNKKRKNPRMPPIKATGGAKKRKFQFANRINQKKFYEYVKRMSFAHLMKVLQDFQRNIIADLATYNLTHHTNHRFIAIGVEYLIHGQQQLLKNPLVGHLVKKTYYLSSIVDLPLAAFGDIYAKLATLNNVHAGKFTPAVYKTLSGNMVLLHAAQQIKSKPLIFLKTHIMLV